MAQYQMKDGKRVLVHRTQPRKKAQRTESKPAAKPTPTETPAPASDGKGKK